MLAFIDESGIPHPSDPCPTWALAAVCFPKESSRRLAGVIHGLKMKHFGKPPNAGDPPVEIKAHALLNGRRYKQAALGHAKALRGANLVESVFDVIQKTKEIAVFGVTGERPTLPPRTPPGLLPLHYLFLLQRIYRHAVELGEETMAVVVFDEKDPDVDAKLSHAFAHFLFSVPEGQAMKNVLETAFFVSSKITFGVQLADLAASCLRQSLGLSIDGQFGGFTPDPFISAIRRFDAILRSKTTDFNDPVRGSLPGIYRMPAKYFQPREPSAPVSSGGGAEPTN